MVVARGSSLMGKWAVEEGWVLSGFVICVIGDGWREIFGHVYEILYVGAGNSGFVS